MPDLELESPDRQGDRSGSVRAVERALALIEIFARSRGPFSITDLAAEAELPASTVHRLVQSLLALGYVTQHQASKRYGVGRGIADLSRAMLLKHEFNQYVQPYLERLANETNETASLTALYGTSILYLNQVESPLLMKVASPVGTIAPLHCTGSGKVFLADFGPRMFDESISFAGLKSHTGNTITDRNELIRHLMQVREQGYAVDDEEYEEGARCIAVGLRGSSGTVSSAISISGPAVRMTDDRMPEIAALVKEVAEKFAHRMREP